MYPEQWTLTSLFEAFPKLTCVIDLTNTTKYYPHELMKSKAPLRNDFNYVKIFTKGHVVPERKVVEK